MKKYILLLTAVTFTSAASAQVLGPDDGSPQTFHVIEYLPEFIGGRSAMRDFIIQHLRYPKKALKAKAEGTVYVKAVVREDSTLSDIAVEGGQHLMPCLKEEAVRVVKMMPKWKPGQQNARPVKSLVTIPVAFKLEEPRKK